MNFGAIAAPLKNQTASVFFKDSNRVFEVINYDDVFYCKERGTDNLVKFTEKFYDFAFLSDDWGYAVEGNSEIFW